jgi:hypothetical protein
MGIGGILAIIISIYGGHLLAQTFSYEALPVMRPFASGYLEGKLSDRADGTPGILSEIGIFTDSKSLEDYIKGDPELAETAASATYGSFGIDVKTSGDMAADAVAYHSDQGGMFETAMSEILCERVSYVVCFLLAFFIIIIVLTVAGNLTNLSLKIPGASIIDNISGAVLGVVTGLIFCTVFVWALKYAGMLIGGDTLLNTIFAKLFLNGSLLTKALGR